MWRHIDRSLIREHKSYDSIEFNKFFDKFMQIAFIIQNTIENNNSKSTIILNLRIK